MFMRSSINYPVVCAQIIRSQLKHGRIVPLKKKKKMMATINFIAVMQELCVQLKQAARPCEKPVIFYRH